MVAELRAQAELKHEDRVGHHKVAKLVKGPEKTVRLRLVGLREVGCVFEV